jgi:hypothetical protein
VFYPAAAASARKPYKAISIVGNERGSGTVDAALSQALLFILVFAAVMVIDRVILEEGIIPKVKAEIEKLKTQVKEIIQP